VAYQRLFAAAGVAALLLCGKALAEPTKRAEPIRTGLLASISLADIGFNNGLRFSNLGGRREIFVPLPQSQELTASEFRLVPLPQSQELTASEFHLVFDDVSAHGL
jgi:hypothetical protein